MKVVRRARDNSYANLPGGVKQKPDNKNGLPEGPSIPHRRCPRGQLGGGGGSGSCSSLCPPCKMYGGKITSQPRFTMHFEWISKVPRRPGID